MKRIHVIGALSLAVNVVLLAGWLLRERPPAAPHADSGQIAPGSAVVDDDAGPAFSSPPSRVWPVAPAGELRALAATLRAAEWPDWLVRAAIGAEIEEQFRTRENALAAARPNVRWWQPDRYIEPLESRLARLDLRRRKAALRREILGVDATAAADDSAARGADDQPVPRDRREEIAMLEEDYTAMIDSIREQAGRALLPSERSAIEMLERERQRDLADLLTPEQLAEYEWRRAPAFGAIQRDLRYFDATEAEFRALVTLQKEFDERFPPRANMATASEHTARDAAAAELQARKRAALGEERAQIAERAADREYQQLRRLAARTGQPPGAAEGAMDLRERFVRDVAEVGENPALSREQKTAALAGLAGQFRGEISGALGAEAGEAYLQSARRWINLVESGWVVRFHENSRFYEARNVDGRFQAAGNGAALRP